MKIINDANIKDYTTYKLSGKMKIIIPDNIDELKEIVKNNNYKIIGNGSNLIIDESYNKTFVKLSNFNHIKISDNIVEVESGYSLPKLCRKCADKGLSGLEFACGIPASIGGALYMNAGAYGKEIYDCIKSITVLDKKLNIIKLDKKDLKKTYRNSIIKENDYICLSAQFELKYKASKQINYEIKTIINLRKEKQPLEFPSAGSVFKNPIGLSAGRLIEKAGLKGLTQGGAQISEKHANFIINKNKADASDVIKLIDIIKKKIKSEFKVDLEVEQEILKG